MIYTQGLNKRVQKINTGDRIYFPGEKKPYKVRASNNKFAICTKPFNLKNTVLYTIIDKKNNIRGTENLIFCMGFESDEDCIEALERLTTKETEISHRNFVELRINKIVNARRA